MVQSVYTEITSLETSSDQEMKNAIISMGLKDIFQHVFDKYSEKGLIRQVCLYVAYAYSWESKMTRVGADWRTSKVMIAEKLLIPAEEYADLVDLQDVMLVDCFFNYIHLMKQETDYVHLITLKDTYQQIMHGINKIEPGVTFSIKDKVQDIKEADELLDSITRKEDKIKDKYRKTFLAQKDITIELYDSNTGNPLRIENSRYIKE